MTDVLQNIAQDGLASMCLFAGTYFDCGSESGYANANMFVVEHRDELN
jgi:UTP-glucose-1-phosphate uridylyltransferase